MVRTMSALVREYVEVDPATLHVPPGLIQVANPLKLARQISKYGRSIDSMPPLEVVRGRGGSYRINDGVTRATRVAKLSPGTLLRAEVIHDLPNLDVSRFPTIREVLP